MNRKNGQKTVIITSLIFRVRNNFMSVRTAVKRLSNFRLHLQRHPNLLDYLITFASSLILLKSVRAGFAITFSME